MDADKLNLPLNMESGRSSATSSSSTAEMAPPNGRVNTGFVSDGVNKEALRDIDKHTVRTYAGNETLRHSPAQNAITYDNNETLSCSSGRTDTTCDDTETLGRSRALTATTYDDADAYSSTDELLPAMNSEGYTWDVFRQNPPDDNDESREQCIFRASQCLKVFSIVFFFILILAGIVLNKGLLLFVMAQIDPHFNVTCRTYAQSPQKNLTKCVAFPPYFTNESIDGLTCIQSAGRLISAVNVKPCPQLALRWIWCWLLLMICPYVYVILRDIWLICLKNEPTPRRDVLFVSLTMDTLYTLGMCLLVFRLLSRIQHVLKAVCILNGLSFLPALLMLLEVPKWSRRAPLIIALNALSVLSQLSAILVWPILDYMKNPEASFAWEGVVAQLLVSLGWWENYVPAAWQPATVPDEIYKYYAAKRKVFTFMESMRASKVKLTLLGNIWKISLTITTTVLLHMDFTMADWFWFLTDYRVLCPQSWGAFYIDKAYTFYYLDWLAVAMLCLSACIVVYFFLRAAAKTHIQTSTYSLAVLCATPVTFGSLYAMCDVWKSAPCNFFRVIPPYSFWNCHIAADIRVFLVDDHGWMAVLWWLSQAWITRHMWFPKAERLAKSKNLFVQPLVDAVVFDPWIVHNRRRVDEHIMLKTDNPLADRFIRMPSSESGEVDLVPTEESIPVIYMCATMWHETKEEIIQILKSIFRCDLDQFKRKNIQDFLETRVPDYYVFEAHVFFDDAMTTTREGIVVVNDFVKILVDSVDEAASAVHDTFVQLKAPRRYPTPYGGRLEWQMPGENKLVAHLKDKNKIRHKKRWSQVMYMYYFLGFKLWNRIKHWDVARSQKMADNTFLLALDGDVDFRPKAVLMLVDLMRKDTKVGAACGRIHPIGSGPMVWYQKFEYALGHWMQKATEHVLGCVLCSPGCFSLFRGSAIMDDNVMRTYTTIPTEARHHVQYDQGEDRWLCTLLLQQGHRVEYSAGSDAFTFAPEGFYEFYNQRRRWMPSTMANILELLTTWRRTIEVNENISLLYIVYHTVLLFASVLGTGTIFLMIVGALGVALKGLIDTLTAFVINLVPLVGFTLVCLTCKSEIQLLLAAILTTVYALLQMLVLVGVIVQIVEEGPLSPNALFFFFVAGTFLLAAILHPQEFLCIVHGFIYFLAIPSMYMLLMIYSMTNMHVISWGTREVKQTKTQKEEEEERKAEAVAKENAKKGLFSQYVKNEEGFTFSIGNLWRCVCCPTPKEDAVRREVQPLLRQLKHVEETMGALVDTVQSLHTGQPEVQEEVEYAGQENWQFNRPRPAGVTREVSFNLGTIRGRSVSNPLYMYDGHNAEGSGIPEKQEPEVERDELVNPAWIEDPRLGDGRQESLSTRETRFFVELIEKYLKPLTQDKVEKEKVEMQLIELRNKMSGTYLLLNAIFVVLVFTLQMNVDRVSIKWPAGDDLRVEPIGFLFLFFFATIMLIQILGMLVHRATTFFHVLASTKLPCERSEYGSSEHIERHLEILLRNLDRSIEGSVTGEDTKPEPKDDKSALDRRGTLHKLHNPTHRLQPRSSTDIAMKFKSKLSVLKRELDEQQKGVEQIHTEMFDRKYDTERRRRESIAALKYLKNQRKILNNTLRMRGSATVSGGLVSTLQSVSSSNLSPYHQGNSESTIRKLRSMTVQCDSDSDNAHADNMDVDETMFETYEVPQVCVNKPSNPCPTTGVDLTPNVTTRKSSNSVLGHRTRPSLHAVVNFDNNNKQAELGPSSTSDVEGMPREISVQHSTHRSSKSSVLDPGSFCSPDAAIHIKRDTAEAQEDSTATTNWVQAPPPEYEETVI